MKYTAKKTTYKRKATSSKKSYKKKSYKKSSPSLVKTIKQTIHRMAENKIWVNYAANQPITSAYLTRPTILGLLPTLSLGTAQNARIGNSVRIMKNIFDYRVNLLPYNASSNIATPVILKIWIVSLKNKNQFEGIPTTSDFDKFFQIGASSAPFQGSILDTMFKVNNDFFTLHTTRTHYLGTTSTTGTSGTGGAYFTGNCNPFASGKIYLDKYVKKLKYQDQLTDVTNRSLWFVVTSVPADGQSVTTLNIQTEFHYNQEVQYEDI